jgi:hypothetical protein
MTNQPGVKIKIPIGKIAAFVALLVTSAKDGYTKEEGHAILMAFIELFAEVLQENVPVA